GGAIQVDEKGGESGEKEPDAGELAVMPTARKPHKQQPEDDEKGDGLIDLHGIEGDSERREVPEMRVRAGVCDGPGVADWETIIYTGEKGSDGNDGEAESGGGDDAVEHAEEGQALGQDVEESGGGAEQDRR